MKIDTSFNIVHMAIPPPAEHLCHGIQSGKVLPHSYNNQIYSIETW